MNLTLTPKHIFATHAAPLALEYQLSKPETRNTPRQSKFTAWLLTSLQWAAGNVFASVGAG